MNNHEDRDPFIDLIAGIGPDDNVAPVERVPPPAPVSPRPNLRVAIDQLRRAERRRLVGATLTFAATATLFVSLTVRSLGGRFGLAVAALFVVGLAVSLIAWRAGRVSWRAVDRRLDNLSDPEGAQIPGTSADRLRDPPTATHTTASMLRCAGNDKNREREPHGRPEDDLDP